METFENEGLAYESKRRKFELDVLFNPGNFVYHLEALKNAVMESIKIVSSNNLNASDAKISRVGIGNRSAMGERT